jgi:hypothetical protein
MITLLQLDNYLSDSTQNNTFMTNFLGDPQKVPFTKTPEAASLLDELEAGASDNLICKIIMMCYAITDKMTL